MTKKTQGFCSGTNDFEILGGTIQRMGLKPWTQITLGNPYRPYRPL